MNEHEFLELRCSDCGAGSLCTSAASAKFLMKHSGHRIETQIARKMIGPELEGYETYYMNLKQA